MNQRRDAWSMQAQYRFGQRMPNLMLHLTRKKMRAGEHWR